MTAPDIHAYIKTQESTFETEEIHLGDNWNWSFRKHVQMIFHLKHGVFYTGENDFLRALKNIMLPMLNADYWIEDIDVKDVVFFIEGSKGRVLSFFIKKYHDEVYVREHDLDELFDDITESDIDYGGVLVQPTNGERPKVIPLNTVAFCDQTETLGGAIGFKFNFSPDKLRQMKKNGWGDTKNGATISIEELITLATADRTPAGMHKKSHTTSKNIEVYLTYGALPEHYLKDNDNMEDWYNQIQITANYTSKDKKKEGVTLYRNKDDGESLLFHTSKKIDGRALGQGTGETLIHPQVWTNFLSIHKMNMLEAAAKVPLVTDDPTYTQKNKIKEMETLEVTTIEDGKTLRQVPTAAPANLQMLTQGVDEWLQHAQLSASDQDPLMGKEAVSGTTFRGQERTVAQGRGFHDRRRGQRAKFIERIYREIMIDDMVKEILDGTKFLASLSSEEMVWVADQLADIEADKRIKKSMLDAAKDKKKAMMSQEDVDQFKSQFKELYMKKGSKQMLEILKKEFKDIDIRMGINVANKQKDLVNLSDKVLSIFQYIFANPQGFQQAMQIPALSRSFQDILEYSGMNQADFQTLMVPSNAPPAQAQAQAPTKAPEKPVLNKEPVA